MAASTSRMGAIVSELVGRQDEADEDMEIASLLTLREREVFLEGLLDSVAGLGGEEGNLARELLAGQHLVALTDDGDEIFEARLAFRVGRALGGEEVGGHVDPEAVVNRAAAAGDVHDAGFIGDVVQVLAVAGSKADQLGGVADLADYRAARRRHRA